jgi:hypothetical protein
VAVIGKQRPDVHRPPTSGREPGQAADEVGAIQVIPEDYRPLDPAHQDVLEDAEGIKAGTAGMAWH